MPSPLELTLILAASRDMGIGRNGTLPWSGLRKEMAYFARVTKSVPARTQAPVLNAVVMGRKTWDSIPPALRPLSGRLNVVISRAVTRPPPRDAAADEMPIRAGSLDQALAYLRAREDLARVFVIGGAQIYEEALRVDEVRRILLTRVLLDFECDTFFPLRLDEAEAEAGAGIGGWTRKGKSALDEWVGDEVPGGKQEENGVPYQFEMWEKVK